MCNSSFLSASGLTISLFNNGPRTDDLDDLYLYDVRSREWQNIKAGGDLPKARSSMGLATVGNNLYLFGGKYNNTGLASL